MNLCERLKKARKDAGYRSQEKFALFLGTTRPAIASYETGAVIPNDVFLQLVSTKLGISFNWLKSGSGTPDIETDETIVESLKQKYNMTNNQKKLMDIFLSMSSEKREQVAQAFFNFVDEAQQFSTADPVQQELSSYEKELRAEQDAANASVSPITDVSVEDKRA